MPSVAVKDIVIQERESDLVLATFGRGFYILDDYSPLREVSSDLINKTAYIFPVKDALMYVTARNKGSQGSTYFIAKNPGFGATFTYYLSDSLITLKDLRHQKEKELFEAKKPIPQPSVEQLRAEEMEDPPFLIFTVTDAGGYEVRRLTAKPKKGINRITWDLKYPSTTPVSIKNNDYDPFSSDPSHYLALPGTYFVSLRKSAGGAITELVPPVEFKVVTLNNTTLPAASREELVAFHTKVSKLRRSIQGAYKFTNELNNRIKYIRQSLLYTPGSASGLIEEAAALEIRINDVLFTFNGQPATASWEEVPPADMPLNRRLSVILSVHSRSTSDVTKTETDNYEILLEEFPPLLEEIKMIHSDILNLENKMEEIEVPWTPGRIPEW